MAPAMESPMTESTPPTPKADRKTSQNKPKPNVTKIGNKTFACGKCKKGHRVAMCVHGGQRPMLPTNPPGRPAAGDQKRKRCDCPKTCSCDKENCRCERVCNCVFIGFLTAYIPGPDEPAYYANKDHIPKVNATGKWGINGECLIDANGDQISEEEAARRRDIKMRQKLEQERESSLRSRSASATFSPARPKAAGGCCEHRNKINASQQANPPPPTAFSHFETAPTSDAIPPNMSQPQPQPPIHTPLHVPSNGNHSMPQIPSVLPFVDQFQPPTSAASGCNCGTDCDCAFCPEHPNNSRSHRLAQDHFQHLYQSHNWGTFANPVSQIHHGQNMAAMSCMGGPPQFALTQERPDVHGHTGHFISYEVYGQTPVGNDFQNFHIGQAEMSYPNMLAHDADNPLLTPAMSPNFDFGAMDVTTPASFHPHPNFRDFTPDMNMNMNMNFNPNPDQFANPTLSEFTTFSPDLPELDMSAGNLHDIQFDHGDEHFTDQKFSPVMTPV